jgi:hypothetical protein
MASYNKFTINKNIDLNVNIVVNLVLVKNSTTAVAITTLILLSLMVLALDSPLFYVKSYAQQQSSLAGGTTFPPPIFYKLRNIPSYAITIPFTTLGFSSYDPPDVSIPLGMTIIWFNDDNGIHSVTTTMANSSYSPPQKIDSGPISPNGGSFIHTFSKPGIYDYYDKFDPRMHGRINVGTGIEPGKNMNMMVGGKISFNPDESRRVVLSFVPKTIAIPPTIALTYQVTISNPLRPWLIFNHRYDDADGILDLELIPTHKSKNNSTDFITWGPDFRSQEAFRTTGTFDIKGPVLVEDSEYDIRIAILAKDGSILSKPIVDTFILLPVQ